MRHILFSNLVDVITIFNETFRIERQFSINLSLYIFILSSFKQSTNVTTIASLCFRCVSIIFCIKTTQFHMIP